MVKFIHVADRHNDNGMLEVVISHASDVNADAILDSGDGSDFELDEGNFDYQQKALELKKEIQGAKRKSAEGADDNGVEKRIREFGERTTKYAHAEGRDHGRLISGCPVPYIYQVGNHDPLAYIKGMKEEAGNRLHLALEKPVEIKGLKIFGLPCFYEGGGFSNLTPQHYPFKISEESQAEAYGREGQKKQVSEDDEVVKAYNDVKPDISLTHKGAMDEACAPRDPLGFHHGLKKVLDESRTINMAGHTHTAVVRNVGGRLELIASPDIFFEVDINPGTKKASNIKVYEYVKPGRKYTIEEVPYAQAA